MKVWRIRDIKNDRFLYGIYPIQGIANKYMIKLAEDEMKKHKLRRKDAWLSVTQSDVYTTGKYHHDEAGLEWETIEVNFVTDEDYRRWKEQRKIEEDYEWHDMEDFSLLRDGDCYEVELADGSTFSSVFYNEDEAIFQSEEAEIQFDDVVAFRRCYQ